MKRWIEPAGDTMSKSFSNDIIIFVLITLCLLFLPAACTPARAQSNDSQAQAGTPAFIIGVMDPMAIHAQIHESDIVNVALGEKAEVTMESVANRTFEATVSRFSLTPLAPGVGDPSYYDIEFTIPNSDYVLKEGFKGEIKFQPSKTAGSSSMKIIDPIGLEKMGDQTSLRMGGKGQT